MQPDENMTAIIGKVRYTVKDSTLLASDCYWDGNNFERHGRNTFLYRTPKRRYFALHMTMWQGERDRIEPMTEDEAYELYEILPEKELEAEDAFPGATIEPA